MAGKLFTETENAINAYFEEVEAEKEKATSAKEREQIRPTAAGLCLALDLTMKELEKIANAYNCDPAERSEKLKDMNVQPGYAKLIYNATLRIANHLQRGETAGKIFAMKQPVFGGWQDKADNTQSAPAIHIHLGGMGKDEHPGK